MYIPVMKELNADDFCEMFLLGRDVRAIEAMEASHSLLKRAMFRLTANESMMSLAIMDCFYQDITQKKMSLIY